MPNKHNDTRRHHIPKMKFKVTNWSDYEAGLRRRGSLTLWVSDEALAAWRAAPQTTPGGQARNSETAIETALMVRLVFHQPLRQTEGLLGSLLELMGTDLPVPDHTIRQSAGGRRTWRKLIRGRLHAAPQENSHRQIRRSYVLAVGQRPGARGIGTAGTAILDLDFGAAHGIANGMGLFGDLLADHHFLDDPCRFGD